MPNPPTTISTGTGPAYREEQEAKQKTARPEYGLKEDGSPLTEDEWLLKSLREFKDAADGENQDRNEAQEDDEFNLGGAYQWPEYARQARKGEGGVGERPMFTVNELGKFCDRTSNAIKQNRPQMRAIPAGKGAAEETAQMVTDLFRHIMANGQGDWPQDNAVTQAVESGWGYMMVTSEYLDDESNDQELRVEAIPNRFTVYPDPSAKVPWLEDMDYCFLSWEQHKDTLPEGIRDWPDQGEGDRSLWVNENNADLKRIAIKWWRAMPEMVEVDGVKRPSTRRKVYYQRMVGHQVLEEPQEWPGRWIPIVRVVGKVIFHGGTFRKKGLIRDAKDAQRMVNFNFTDATEDIALGIKVGALGAEGQFEGHESDWAKAMWKPLATLEYKPTPIESGGSVVLPPPPQINPRAEVPAANLQMMQASHQMLREVTGVMDANLGQQSNEKSGKALIARQQQGDITTFHYTDHLRASLRHLGRILVDLLPHYYDSKRMQRVLNEYDEERMVEIDPNLTGPDGEPASYVEEEVPDGPGTETKKKTRFRLDVGNFDIRVTTGRSYENRQQEMVDSMGNVLQVMGDASIIALPDLFDAMDWPGSDKIAEMLRKFRDHAYPMLKEPEEGEDMDPEDEVQMLRAQLQQIIPAFQELQQQAAQMAQELQSEELKAKVEIFKANNDRLIQESEAMAQIVTERIRAHSHVESARQAAAAKSKEGNNGVSGRETG